MSHGGKFVYVNDEWKWTRDKSTSILVPSGITIPELLLRLNEKLGVFDPLTKLELKFKVPNMNMPPAEILEDEDVNWYISVHKETVLCVTTLETGLPSVEMKRDTNYSQQLFAVAEDHHAVQDDELNHQQSVLNNNAADTPIFDVRTAPLDEMFDDPLHGTNTGNIADVDEELLSHSKSPDTCYWISTVNMPDLTEREIFFTKKELYSRICLLALREKFQFQVSRSSQKMLTVVCADDNCKWMLRASSVKQSAIFMIRKFNNVHTCPIDYRRNAHQHATSSVIAEQIMGKLDNTYGSYDPTAIARDMEREFGVKICYHQARREKVAALHLRCGTLGDSFQKLSSYCHVLGESNPGTVTYIEIDTHNKIHYLFLAFGASIRGYLHYMRPVICVDSSHLKGPYKGTLLLTTAQDANKQIYPLAWGIVDTEMNRLWMWFLSNLKDLIGDSDELVFVSDRKNSTENAIAHLFPRAHHGCCIWHMEKNLIQRYNNASSIFLFKRAVRTYRNEKFERLMRQLRRVSARAYRYLERAGFPFWSRALFVGQRYNILTNNNTESLNSMLRHARSLPITCLVEHIRHTMQKWFYERQASATACNTVLSPTMENELWTTFEAGTRLQAHGLTNNLTQVGISNNTDIIDFFEKTCTCREFQLNRMSCVHATRAACLRGKSLYDLSSPYYTSEYWKGAYGKAIYPIQREVDWNVSPEITGTPIMPPSVRRPPGRPPTQRKRSRHEYTTRLRKCTRCGGLGHNRTTCLNHTVSRPMKAAFCT
ncbi:uncharacterized protein LOC111408408 [Olea europaea var. sylvestris]|uniref:uncharacterized protein LOC111408408 n=1 Tax=Olea europaea var. sylvestris TaxID=158386 RepID=UPI000C1CEE5C|nr:uncharacterized protein LOC111408408 [Olea europaea var. sylvestris]